MFLSEIYNLLGKEFQGNDKNIKGIKIDSKELKKGDVFVCINKGYLYIKEAIKKKVSLIIMDKDISIDKSINVIQVKDAVKTLGMLASFMRDKYQGKVIAITGSNGKSTTKEIISHILKGKYKVLSNIGSENNHIGVPKTLLKLNNSYDYVVLELGTNHPGEITYLSDIVKPDIAIITNIGNAHIGNFGSKRKILKEKLCIKKDKTILFVNAKDKLLKDVEGIKVDYTKYSFDNEDICLAYVLCLYLGMTKEEINKRLKSLKLLPSRMYHYNINNITIIDDAYNASYESFIYGINKLDKIKRKIIIYGDMLELGRYSNLLHKKVYKELLKLDNKIIITIGSNTKKLNNKLHFNTLEEIINYFKDFNFEDNDIIYLKGSHKMELFKLVDPLKKMVAKKR